MLQLLNCRFGFAQGFQIEIVLVFLFVLLTAQRQRFSELRLFRLGFLQDLRILQQTFLQWLIARMKRR